MWHRRLPALLYRTSTAARSAARTDRETGDKRMDARTPPLGSVRRWKDGRRA